MNQPIKTNLASGKSGFPCTFQPVPGAEFKLEIKFLASFQRREKGSGFLSQFLITETLLTLIFSSRTMAEKKIRHIVPSLKFHNGGWLDGKSRTPKAKCKNSSCGGRNPIFSPRCPPWIINGCSRELPEANVFLVGFLARVSASAREGRGPSLFLRLYRNKTRPSPHFHVAFTARHYVDSRSFLISRVNNNSVSYLWYVPGIDCYRYLDTVEIRGNGPKSNGKSATGNLTPLPNDIRQSSSRRGEVSSLYVIFYSGWHLKTVRVLYR